MRSCIGALCDALGCRFILIALWQCFDWGTDILFLEANIYSPEFRAHPSFETTKNCAIIFDVIGFVVLMYALKEKATISLRIRKLEKQGRFLDEDQVKRFKNVYSNGQTATKWALYLLLCEDIPEAVITVHVIQATGSMSDTTWIAVITSCSSFLMTFAGLNYSNHHRAPGRFDATMNDHDKASREIILADERHRDQDNCLTACAIRCIGPICNDLCCVLRFICNMSFHITFITFDEEDIDVAEDVYGGDAPGLAELLRELMSADPMDPIDACTAVAELSAHPQAASDAVFRF